MAPIPVSASESVLPTFNEKAQPPMTMTPTQSRPQPRSKNRVFISLAILLALSWTTYSLRTKSVQLPFLMATQTPLEPQVAPVSPSPNDDDSSSKNLIKLMDLPHSYLPQTGKHRDSARLVVVGDVHGMKESLEHLLAEVKFDKVHDHLILAGDMISKGPDSKGVIDLAMKLGATGIRGNHEDRVLGAYKKWRKSDAGEDVTESDEVEFLEESEDEAAADGEVEAAGKRKKDRQLIKKLGKRRLKWLEQCPVILRVGKLGKMGEVVVVHAGLAPGVELKHQDPETVMNMRTIDDDGVPNEGRKGTPWIKPWNKFQKSLPKHDRKTVIYGHDSRKGLRVKKYSMGLDTGCVKGGELTAVVIEGGHIDHTTKIVQVECKDDIQYKQKSEETDA